MVDNETLSRMSDTERKTYEFLQQRYRNVCIRENADGVSFLGYDESKGTAFLIPSNIDLRHGISVLVAGDSASGYSAYSNAGTIKNFENGTVEYSSPILMVGQYKDTDINKKMMEESYKFLTSQGENIDHGMFFLHSGGGYMTNDVVDFVNEKGMRANIINAETANFSRFVNPGASDKEEKYRKLNKLSKKFQSDKISSCYIFSSTRYLDHEKNPNDDVLYTQKFVNDSGIKVIDLSNTSHETLNLIITDPNRFNILSEIENLDDLNITYNKDSKKYIITDNNGNRYEFLDNMYSSIGGSGLLDNNTSSVEYNSAVSELNSIRRVIYKNYLANDSYLSKSFVGTSGFPQNIYDLTDSFQSFNSKIMNKLIGKTELTAEALRKYYGLELELVKETKLLGSHVDSNGSSKVDLDLDYGNMLDDKTNSETIEENNVLVGQTYLSDLKKMYDGNGLTGALKNKLEFEIANSIELTDYINEMISNKSINGPAGHVMVKSYNAYTDIMALRKECSDELEKLFVTALGPVYNFIDPNESFDDSNLESLENSLSSALKDQSRLELLVFHMPRYIYVDGEDGQTKKQIENPAYTNLYGSLMANTELISSLRSEIAEIHTYQRLIKESNDMITSGYETILRNYVNKTYEIINSSYGDISVQSM